MEGKALFEQHNRLPGVIRRQPIPGFAVPPVDSRAAGGYVCTDDLARDQNGVRDRRCIDLSRSNEPLHGAVDPPGMFYAGRGGRQLPRRH